MGISPITAKRVISKTAMQRKDFQGGLTIKQIIRVGMLEQKSGKPLLVSFSVNGRDEISAKNGCMNGLD